MLVGDQPVGMPALGVERVGGDHSAGKVQTVQQRPEPGDLVGGGVDVGLRQDRAELPEGPPKRAQSRAWTRALADLQAAYPAEYAACYQVELAAYRKQHGYDQPTAGLSEGIDPRALTRARAIVLEALAEQYPEQAEQLTGSVVAGLPADASAEMRAAARLLALDRLRALYPRQFQARYAAELARHAGQADQEQP